MMLVHVPWNGQWEEKTMEGAWSDFGEVSRREEANKNEKRKCTAITCHVFRQLSSNFQLIWIDNNVSTVALFFSVRQCSPPRHSLYPTAKTTPSTSQSYLLCPLFLAKRTISDLIAVRTPVSRTRGTLSRKSRVWQCLDSNEVYSFFFFFSFIFLHLSAICCILDSVSTVRSRHGRLAQT